MVVWSLTLITSLAENVSYTRLCVSVLGEEGGIRWLGGGQCARVDGQT